MSSYDQNILMSRTGSKLLSLFDKMESLVSRMYHSSPMNDKIEGEYFEIYDEIANLKQIRDNLMRKNRRKNMF